MLGFPGGYNGSLLPSGKIELPVALEALGQVLSVAAAAAAIPAPAGAIQLGTSVAAFLGQAAQASGLAVESARKFNGQHVPSKQPADPNQLIYVIRQLMSTRKPIVVVLDDLQLADPHLQWCRIFLKNLIRPLLADYPLMLIVSTDSGPLAEPNTSEYFDVMSGLTKSGQAIEVKLNFLSSVDIQAWLGKVADNLLTDLLTISGGHPGWTVKLFTDWRAMNIVESPKGIEEWRYSTNGRQLAKDRANDFVYSVIWRLAKQNVDLYEKMLRVLKTAALEGTIFTADVVARALELDRDELIDWLDDEFVANSGNDGAPIEEYEVSELQDPADPRQKRFVCRYRFRSSIYWAALNRDYELSSENPWPTREQACRAYAESLISVYAADCWLVARTISSLLAQAGSLKDAEFYGQLWDLRGPRDLYREVLLDDLRFLQNASEEGNSLELRQALVIARRVYRMASALEGVCDDGEDLQGYQATRALAISITQAAPSARQLVKKSHAASLAPGLGRVEFTNGHWGAAVCYSKYAADRWSEVKDFGRQANALLLCMAGLSQCLGFLSSEDHRLYDECIGFSASPPLETPISFGLSVGPSRSALV